MGRKITEILPRLHVHVYREIFVSGHKEFRSQSRLEISEINTPRELDPEESVLLVQRRIFSSLLLREGRGKRFGGTETGERFLLSEGVAFRGGVGRQDCPDHAQEAVC